jgi:hypothetical protein
MPFSKLTEIRRLKKELERLRDENDKLREAQRRCTECENFDKRRGFAKETAEEKEA